MFEYDTKDVSARERPSRSKRQDFEMSGPRAGSAGPTRGSAKAQLAGQGGPIGDPYLTGHDPPQPMRL